MTNPIIKKLLFAAFSFCFVLQLTAGMLVTGRVTVSNLYVRAKPDKKYNRVATLNKGATVIILGEKGEWYKILAPSTTTTWVPESHLANNVISKSTYIYSGPSIAYTTLGSLSKGTVVKLLKQPGKKGWIQIEAPQGTTAWVSKSFVNVPKVVAPKIAQQSIPEQKVLHPAQPKSSAPVGAAKDSAIISPVDKKAIKARAAGQKAPAKATGKVAKATKAQKPVAKVAKATKAQKPVGKVAKATKTQKAVAKVAKASKATAKPAPRKRGTRKKTAAKPSQTAPADVNLDEEVDMPTISSADMNVSLTYIPGTAEKVRRSGYVLPLINPVYVTNALGRKVDNRILPYCFIHCKGFDFSKLQHDRQKIMIFGTQRKVKGWKLPAIEVEKVYVGNKLIYRVPKTRKINL